ncbi:hypothetical protein KAZ92_01725 [Candidatus Gracilibacteria bacterium]|nr:hypothetical protein [Candidatus Gracilibacteria bacterium]
MDRIWRFRPIPAIRLKYNRRPGKGEHAFNDLICEQCGKKNIRIGSGGEREDGSQYTNCEDCAIDNYRYYEGFATRKAAAAFRRRMFDIQYLFREMLTDLFMEQRNMRDVEELSVEQLEALVLLTQEIYNRDVPKSAKLRLENMKNQEDIEKYLVKKLKKVGVFLAMIS